MQGQGGQGIARRRGAATPHKQILKANAEIAQKARFYRFIIKYVTPLFLLVLLGWWSYENGLPLLLLKGVSRENVPIIVGVRLLLVGLFGLLAYLVWHSGRRKRNGVTS